MWYFVEEIRNKTFSNKYNCSREVIFEDQLLENGRKIRTLFIHTEGHELGNVSSPGFQECGILNMESLTWWKCHS